MGAALDLLSEYGEEGVSLRELTTAADANVAAVSYHFGSLQALLDEAIEDALERYLDTQQQAVSALGPESTLEELAAAFAQPMISALTKGGRDRRRDPHRGAGRDRSSRTVGSVRRQVRPDSCRRRARTEAKLAGVKPQELSFRIRCAAGMLNWLALAPIAADISAMSEKQAGRLLVPVVAGAFRATNSG